MIDISADDWNDLIRRVRSGRALEGLNALIKHTSNGTLITADTSSDWKHPWQVSARYETFDLYESEIAAGLPPGEWRAYIRPGFVNGREVTITMNDRDPKTREVVTSASRAKNLPPIEVPLTDEAPPWLSLSWRNPIASQGEAASEDGELISLAGEGYPDFFNTLGVKPPARASNDTSIAPPADPSRTRELRACDIILVTPRIATNNTVSIGDPISGATSATITTTFIDDIAASAPSQYRLKAEPKWTPPQEPTMEDRLLGTAVEPQTDEIKIATLWMVSPPNATDQDEPDWTWTPYPQHFVFWNLMHAPHNLVPPFIDNPITFNIPLAGGVAQSLFNSLLAQVNDANSAAYAALNQTTYAGKFWSV